MPASAQGIGMTAVLVMAKAPHPGAVKTRLQPPLGPAGCARLPAECAGLEVGLLPTLRDLDTPEDATALLADPLLPGHITDLLRTGGGG
ncbi:MAG: hypothetical protein ACRDRN_20775 [Sciscionella sp.]